MSYQSGDVANGHVLGSDGVWHPVGSMTAASYDRPMKNALGGWSLALGVVSVLFFWVPVFGMLNYVTAPTGIALGYYGLKRARTGLATNAGVALAGIVLSSIALALTVAFTLYFFSFMAEFLGAS